MTPVDQEFLEIRGDCMRAATATLLDLPISEVPHFYALETMPGECIQIWANWLAERGFALIEFEGHPQVAGGYIAVGLTLKGNRHAVVMADGELAHDPWRPNPAGLAEILETYVIVPQERLRRAA